MKSNKISSKTLLKGKSFEVISQTSRFSDEMTPLTFEYIERPCVALIVPVLENHEVVVIRQYRAAIDDFVLEFPAGKKTDSETIEETAIRELEEETGYLASEVVLIGKFHTAPHFSNEKVYVYLATGLKAQNENSFSDHEFIITTSLPLERVVRAFENERIKDAKSIIGLQFYKSFMNG